MKKNIFIKLRDYLIDKITEKKRMRALISRYELDLRSSAEIDINIATRCSMLEESLSELRSSISKDSEKRIQSEELYKREIASLKKEKVKLQIKLTLMKNQK